jgi:predicted nucleic acid-binding protein
MDILADTNILSRRINRYAAQHKEARTALRILEEHGHRVCIVLYRTAEYHRVLERRVAANRPERLGLLPGHVERIVARIEDTLHMLPERPEINTEWKKVVTQYAVSGLKVYDARLVASALVYGIESMPTFNGDDFRRYPAINLIHPRDVTQDRI